MTACAGCGKATDGTYRCSACIRSLTAADGPVASASLKPALPAGWDTSPALTVWHDAGPPRGGERWVRFVRRRGGAAAFSLFCAIFGGVLGVIPGLVLGFSRPMEHDDILGGLIVILLLIGGEIVGVVAGVWFATWLFSLNDVREPHTCDLPFLLTLPFLAVAIFIPVFGLLLFGLVGGSVVYRVKTRINKEIKT